MLWARTVAVCGLLCVVMGAGCSFDVSGYGPDQSETDCRNDADDDRDGLTDCDDPDCATDLGCQGNSNNTNSNNNNNNNTNPPPEICDNSVDDDGDGLQDCDDPECASALHCQAEDCENQTDDNGNGLQDCDDPECALHPTCVPEICDNGLDDDGDGLQDCADEECANEPHCLVEICDNGADDDLDGYADCEDDDCLGTANCGPCHPITNAGCSGGQVCHIHVEDQWLGRCISSSGTDTQWDYCTDYTECQAGFYCSVVLYTCVKVCRPGSSECSPYPGTSCNPFSDLGSPGPWGYCYY